MVAMEMGLPPSEVWAMSPQDLATVVAVMEDRANALKRR